MDLRNYMQEQLQVDRAAELIAANQFGYQPFIFSDNLEVGEGQNFADRYCTEPGPFDDNVYSDGYDIGDRRRASHKRYFRECNKQLRKYYEFIADYLEERYVPHMHSFSEIGCNNGLTLFELARRGAKECIGYDWDDRSAAFDYLNSLLSVEVEYYTGAYNNLYHRFDKGCAVQETDIMINTVFLNHQCDPLQFLCYLCDRARKGVFLWVLTHEDSGNRGTVSYPLTPPHAMLATENPFPLYFNNDVTISEGLLLLSLRRLGFGDIAKLDKPTPPLMEMVHPFNMYFARRTEDIKSAYSWNKNPSRLGRLANRCTGLIKV